MKIDREKVDFRCIHLHHYICVCYSTLTDKQRDGAGRKNQELLKVKAILNAMGISYQSDDEALNKFRSDVQQVENESKYEIYKANSGGRNLCVDLFW